MTLAKTKLIIMLAVFGTLAASAVIAQSLDLPEAAGKKQVVESCIQCHGVDVILAQRRTPDEWSQVVALMVGQGAKLTDSQYKTVIDYLSTNLTPPATAPAPVASR